MRLPGLRPGTRPHGHRPGTHQCGPGTHPRGHRRVFGDGTWAVTTALAAALGLAGTTFTAYASTTSAPTALAATAAGVEGDGADCAVANATPPADRAITVHVSDRGKSASFPAGVSLPGGTGPFPVVIVLGGLGAGASPAYGLMVSGGPTEPSGVTCGVS